MLKNLTAYPKEAQNLICAYYTNPPTLLKYPLSLDEKIAYVTSTSLGDTLIGLVTANNLLRNGYTVDVYGDFAYQLRDWFPHINIVRAIPSLENQHVFADYKTVLHHHERPISIALAAWHPHSIVIHHEPACRLPISEVDIQMVVCEVQFKLKDLVRENGIKPLAGLIPRKYKNRVCLHPRSSTKRKSWQAAKFVKLAKRLTNAGYQPFFVVSKAEHAEWIEETQNAVESPLFPTLSAAAKTVCESGYFIGNDSGIGHLASNLGVPTVSIILRKGTAKRWRPTWAAGEIVLSPDWVNPRPIKELLWKYFISVNMVYAGFKHLITRVENQNE